MRIPLHGVFNRQHSSPRQHSRTRPSSFLPTYLPSFLPTFLPSFLPSFLFHTRLSFKPYNFPSSCAPSLHPLLLLQADKLAGENDIMEQLDFIAEYYLDLKAIDKAHKDAEREKRKQREAELNAVY